MVDSRENDIGSQNCVNMVHTVFVLKVHIDSQLRAQGLTSLMETDRELPTLT